jgi:hypothetical protein
MTPYDYHQLKKRYFLRLQELSVIAEVHLERANHLDRLAAEVETLRGELTLYEAMELTEIKSGLKMDLSPDLHTDSKNIQTI